MNRLFTDMEDSEVIFSDSPAEGLTAAVNGAEYDRIFVLADTNTARCALPLFGTIAAEAPRFTMCAGEEYKNVSTLTSLWEWLSREGATRSSILVNIGGGVVTDLGGFAAATFKRGIRHINVPTSLLGAADAAVGGKTGIDFTGLKNEIGAFAPARAVVVSAAPFATLPMPEVLSGLAEIMKMAMIASPEIFARLLSALDEADYIIDPAGPMISRTLRFAIEEKMRIVEQDPREAGIRRWLNFGHTAGHAFEAVLLRKGRAVSHGCAVAHGIAVALILSHLLVGAPSDIIHRYCSGFLKPLYPRLSLGCPDVEPIIDLMKHDKKNHADRIRFVLLRRIGEPELAPVELRDINAALDIYMDMMN